MFFWTDAPHEDQLFVLNTRVVNPERAVSVPSELTSFSAPEDTAWEKPELVRQSV